jgi:hypothetical protein
MSPSTDHSTKPLAAAKEPEKPTDRAKLGWKWSRAVDANGIPIGWAIDGANRNDIPMLEPTIATIAERGLLAVIIIGRLLDYRNRWSPASRPAR